MKVELGEEGTIPALPARSVILSLLLGSHPPEMPVRALVRTAGLFGISSGAARVALSRLSADGEVVGAGGVYRLSDRHLVRQRDQDAALRPALREWDGRTWEVLTSPPSAAATARLAAGRKMARLHPGVWARPANLVEPPPLPGPQAQLWVGELAGGGPVDPAELWALDGWAETARSLMADLVSSRSPADRLAVAAAIVRHIRSDPLLPPALLPAGWPAGDLRRVYDSYRAELGRLIAGEHDDPVG